MLYPAQTSMMPATVALARFWESQLSQNGWFAIRSLGEGWYPYWYLGVPFKYLGGPAVPFLLVGLHRFFPGSELFELYLFLTGVFWLLGAVSFYFLVRKLSRRNLPAGQAGLTAFLAALIFLCGPFLPWFFPFSDGTRLISFSFLPLIFLLYLEIFKKWSRLKAGLTVVLIAVVLLIDTLVLPALLLGMLALLLTVASWEKIERQFKKTAFILILGFALATLWYTPAYWWHLWFAPSFAGKGLGSVIVLITRLLMAVTPILLAIFSLKQLKQKNILFNFAFLWTFIFGFLTLVRFISDPDFWQDWTSYALELQMGGAIILAILIVYLLRLENLSILPRGFFLGGTAVLLSLPWVLTPYKFLGLRSNIQNSVEYQTGRWLSENVKVGERVYLSGTTAFWLNSLGFGVAQMRGGVDQGATHPFWAKASYEIREGKDGRLARDWLKALGATYLVVHNSNSREYYRDFQYPSKFETLDGLKKLREDSGDIIYRVEGASLARVVDLRLFKALRMSRDGADQEVVFAYVSSLGRPLEIKRVEGNQLLVQGDFKEGEGISLAITWDRKWKCDKGCKVEKDSLGNLLLVPKNSGLTKILLGRR